MSLSFPYIVRALKVIFFIKRYQIIVPEPFSPLLGNILKYIIAQNELLLNNFPYNYLPLKVTTRSGCLRQ